MASDGSTRPPEAAVSAATSAAAALAPTSPPPVAAVAYNSEWAASLQAYYSSGAAAIAATGAPAVFFPPAAATASPHHYVWPAQHLVTPYGTPIPFSPMYHPGAFYTHPSPGVSLAYPAAEVEGKSNDKGGSGNTRSSPDKSGDGGKGSSASRYNGSRSSDSGSDGSSDTRDDAVEQKESSAVKNIKYGNKFAEGESSQALVATPYNNTTIESPYAARGRSATKLPVSAPGRTMLPNAATNLNIGMDIWGPTHAGAEPLNVIPSKVNVASTVVGRDGVMSQQKLQDERELKRERRKQSNRESARRSRLRKQQECEELARKVAELNSENSELKAELDKLKKACEEMEAKNSQIMGEMIRSHGPGILSSMGIDINLSKIPGARGSHDADHSNKSNGKYLSGNADLES